MIVAMRAGCGLAALACLVGLPVVMGAVAHQRLGYSTATTDE
jgi:hypothetical protein